MAEHKPHTRSGKELPKSSKSKPKSEKKLQTVVSSTAPPTSRDPSLPQDVGYYKKDSLQVATDLIQDKEELLQQEVVPHLEHAELKLEETKYHLNYSLRSLLTDDWKTVDLAKLREENKSHQENETKYWATITSTEQKIDAELKELRRLYLQGAVNLHLHKPTQEQISADKNILGDFKKSTQRLASAKQYLITGSSMRGADHGSSFFRAVTNIQEDAIKKLPMKSEEGAASKDVSGLIGTGPHGTKVYSAEWLKYPIAVKHFSKTVHKDRLNVLKNMESFKHLLALRGIVIPKDEKKSGTILVVQLCVNLDVRSVLSSGTYHFSFPRKLKWIQAMCHALEWLHKRDPQIIHSRLHPGNLLLTSEWKLVVADYGLGYEVPTGEETFFYAPELLQTKKETTAADVYSFATSVWYIITERKGKYSSMPLSKVTEALQGGNSTIFPPGMPKALETLLLNCAKVDPNSRPNFFAMNEDIDWEAMNTASLSKNSEEASSIWANSQKNGKVGFDDLADAYMNSKLVKNKLTKEQREADPSWRCLASFFGVEDGKLPKPFITEQDWMKFVHFFHPIDQTTLFRLSDLFAQKWYYGRLSKASAVAFLEATITNSKCKRAFLVRESNFTKEGNAASGESYTRYTVTSVDIRVSPTPEHTRLPKIQTSVELIAFINQHYSPKAGWHTPVTTHRALEKCFTKGDTQLYVGKMNHEEKKETWDEEVVRYVP